MADLGDTERTPCRSGIEMDDYLREIQTAIFRKWISNQKRDYYYLYPSETDPDAIIIENEYCYSYVTFNPQCIIELCVMNKRTDEMAFYLHFQFKTLKHAISLFEEMDQCIQKMVNQPICRLLLCCSGGMTTAFFADKIKNGIKVLNLNMEVAATSYQKIYNVAQNYDVILLAPQVSYVKLQVEKVFKNKLVLKIPTQIFASYNVGALITFVEESIKNKEKKYDSTVEPLASMMEIKTKKNILAVSINANGENSHISYRLYNNLQEIVLDSNIIKSNIKLHDVLDALDTVVLQNEMIDVISIALPGVMVEGNVYSGIIEGGNHQLKELLEKRYEKEIYLINDVNAAVVGYYASQNQYKSIAFLFQPIGRMAGSGIIVNGQLVRGMDHLAGEVALLPLKLSNDYFTLANTPEGTLELVSKNIMSIIAIVSPEAIVVYSDLILDSQDVSDEIKKSLSQYSLKVYPKIIKVENILEYILLGAMILSAKE